VEIRELLTDECLLTIEGVGNLQPPTVAWSPDGTRLAANGTLWGRVRTLPCGQWKIGRGNPIHTQEVNQPDLSSVVWSPDDTRFACVGADHAVLVCDAETKMTPLTYRGHTSQVYALAWSPDGTRLASGGEDHKVQIWEVATGNLLLTYEGHADVIYALGWSPDGMRVASASADNTIHVWLST
jgi:WD40 repeat protein